MNTAEQQYVLGRNTIDMILDYSDDADVLEYVNMFCMSLAHIFGEDSVVDWYGLESVTDQRYYSLQQRNPVPIHMDSLRTERALYQSKIDECDDELYAKEWSATGNRGTC